MEPLRMKIERERLSEKKTLYDDTFVDDEIVLYLWKQAGGMTIWRHWNVFGFDFIPWYSYTHSRSIEIESVNKFVQSQANANGIHVRKKHDHRFHQRFRNGMSVCVWSHNVYHSNLIWKLYVVI